MSRNDSHAMFPSMRSGLTANGSLRRSARLTALLLALGTASAGPLIAQDAAKVARGDARGGLAIRVTWFECEDPALPARVTKFTFPVACDYDSQEIRSVTPLRKGCELVEDEHGNTTMVYPDPIVISPEAPLYLGSVNDVVLYSRATLKVRPSRIRSAKTPTKIAERYLANDAILTLEHPEIAGLAKELMAGAEDPLDIVLRTWRHVYRSVSYGRVERPNTAAQVLEWGKGQCGEYGKLTIALLRANGIPARGVWCLRAGNTGPAGNDHAWAEAWIGGIGWFPIRPQEAQPSNDVYPLGYHSYQVVCRPQCGMDELRQVEWENASCPTGYRGVGFFADVPEGQRKSTIALFKDIAEDSSSRAARRQFKRAGKAHRAVQPMLYWLLTASADEKEGTNAAKALVEVCSQKDRRLSIERFVDASPSVIRARIEAARTQ